MFQNSSITLAQRSIKTTLKNSLLKKYGIDNDEIVDSILKIHGLHKDNFDSINNIESIIENNLNDISIDDNSNKNEKVIEGILSEVNLPIKKIIGYRYLYRTLNKLYGKEEALRLTGEMYDFSLALSDSSSILKSYCWVIDSTKLITEGRKFGMLNSKPAKRISSYISALCETVHQMSNHLAGAVGMGLVFIDCSYLLLLNKISLNKLKKDKKIRKQVENEFQQLVHSVNHLSRNSNESPFTNLSVFDYEKLNNLINQDNYGWLFDLLNKKYSREYLIEYIMEVQKIFLDFFNQGDPSKNGLQYRFPVITINLSEENKQVKDKRFLDYVCNLDIYRYNIFASKGNKISSCCRLLSDPDMLELASQANSFGASSGSSIGSHRVITIDLNRVALEAKSVLDYFKILDCRLEDSSKILKAHKQLLVDLRDRGLQPFIKNNWINLRKLFSTYGIIGYCEAIETLKSKFNIDLNKDILSSILKYINRKSKEYSKKYNIIINIEQIPGESMAYRLCDVDKLIFGKEKVQYHLYSNQFVPLWENTPIFKRFEINGKYNSLLSGGGICHATIGEKVTSNQAKNLIEYAVQAGCEHFALNAIYSICNKDHFIFGKKFICPECGENIKDYMSRVVGFFVPISSFNKSRREWEFPNRFIENL